MGFQFDGSAEMCYYCKEYAKIYSDYPENPAIDNEFNDMTPRCKFHHQYLCHSCNKNYHFNGISWCSECKVFTCVSCTQEKIIHEKFFFYDYYYSIECHKCKEYNPSLDFAEFSLQHPIQIGDLKPDYPINLWINMGLQPNKVEIGSGWGKTRIRKLSTNDTFTRLDDLDEFNPEINWNENAEEWGGQWPEGGDFNHKHIILPEVLRLMDLSENRLKVLDVACGEGNVSRLIAKKNNEVTGIDISKNMLSYAVKKEEESPLGIHYSNLNAENISERFQENTFDRIVCNMAIMDIENHISTFEQVYRALKPGGLFVFSVLHPCFSWPTTHTIKLPRDSNRNEDKIWIIDDYFDNRPTTIQHENLPYPLLYFPRTISEYVNSLIGSGFKMLEISEPKVEEELINKYPRDLFNDFNRKVDFIIFKLTK